MPKSCMGYREKFVAGMGFCSFPWQFFYIMTISPLYRDSAILTTLSRRETYRHLSGLSKNPFQWQGSRQLTIPPAVSKNTLPPGHEASRATRNLNLPWRLYYSPSIIICAATLHRSVWCFHFLDKYCNRDKSRRQPHWRAPASIKNWPPAIALN